MLLPNPLQFTIAAGLAFRLLFTVYENVNRFCLPFGDTDTQGFLLRRFRGHGKFHPAAVGKISFHGNIHVVAGIIGSDVKVHENALFIGAVNIGRHGGDKHRSRDLTAVVPVSAPFLFAVEAHVIARPPVFGGTAGGDSVEQALFQSLGILFFTGE